MMYEYTILEVVRKFDDDTSYSIGDRFIVPCIMIEQELEAATIADPRSTIMAWREDEDICSFPFMVYTGELKVIEHLKGDI